MSRSFGPTRLGTSLAHSTLVGYMTKTSAFETDLAAAAPPHHRRTLHEQCAARKLIRQGAVRFGPARHRVLASTLEGIVSKRAKSPYRSGRKDAWLKVKCFTEGPYEVDSVEASKEGIPRSLSWRSGTSSGSATSATPWSAWAGTRGANSGSVSRRWALPGRWPNTTQQDSTSAWQQARSDAPLRPGALGGKMPDME
jgi:hypothetical protein